LKSVVEPSSSISSNRPGLELVISPVTFAVISPEIVPSGNSELPWGITIALSFETSLMACPSTLSEGPVPPPLGTLAPGTNASLSLSAVNV